MERERLGERERVIIVVVKFLDLQFTTFGALLTRY